jgi:cephalosporin-C deacetylase
MEKLVLMSFAHDYPFDPTYGYDLEALLAVEPPPEPPDFADFWRARLDRALAIEPSPRLRVSDLAHPGFRIHDLEYDSTDGVRIRGWLLTPRHQPPRLGLILGHGYGGIERPPLDLPRADAAYLIPCFRGLSLSRRPPISEDPNWHVLHDIQDPNRYVLAGCVDDLWTGVTALLDLLPELAGHLGYAGISLGGGLGAIALAWDARLGRGHLNVPTFGHQPLRLELPCVGSGEAVRVFARTHGRLPEALRYLDAALAARHIRQPVHVAAARFDPVVPPPGQFAVYNALPGDRRLFVLEAGHFDYPRRRVQGAELLSQLWAFFAPL